MVIRPENGIISEVTHVLSLVIFVVSRGPLVWLNKPMAAKTETIKLSCEKSTYIVRLSGKVLGEKSRVLLVCKPWCAGESVRRPMSSLMYPTPCTGPSGAPYLTGNQLAVWEMRRDGMCTQRCRISGGPRRTRRSQNRPRRIGNRMD